MLSEQDRNRVQQLINKTIEDLLDATTQHRFDEATVEQVFEPYAGEPVIGHFRLLTANDPRRGRITSGGMVPDVKQTLLRYLRHDVKRPATGPITCFQFIPEYEVTQALARHGLSL